jgi:hypothetical protein
MLGNAGAGDRSPQPILSHSSRSVSPQEWAFRVLIVIHTCRSYGNGSDLDQLLTKTTGEARLPFHLTPIFVNLFEQDSVGFMLAVKWPMLLLAPVNLVVYSVGNALNRNHMLSSRPRENSPSAP